MKRSIPVAVACIMLVFSASAPTQADSFSDAAPIYRNVNLANSGKEVIIPRQGPFGTDQSGHPLGKRLWLDVYPVGRTTLLYSSASRDFDTMPCSDPRPGYRQYREDEKTVVLPGSYRTHRVYTVDVGCEEVSGETKYQNYIFVYSADVSRRGGSVWTKTYTFADGYLESFQGVDTNGDGTLDALMLVMRHAVSDGYDMDVVFLNQATGAIRSSATYPTTRIEP